MQEWYAYVKVCAKKHKLPPSLCAALAAGESGYGEEEVRFGWVGGGKYYAPYNICRSGVRKYNITDWKSCTEVGIMLLANKLKDANGNLHAALRTYNTGDKGKDYDRYVNNIRKLRKQYEKRKVFEDEPRNLALKIR